MNKEELRRISLERRKSLSPEDRENLSSAICSLFFDEVPCAELKVIHSFLPITRNNEPDTWKIIDRLSTDFPKIRIVIPRIQGKDLEHFYYSGRDQLRINDWGIMEPVGGESAAEKDIDLVVVPLLAFDKQGHRVGYGRGYYDRFLKKCRPDCIRTGLSFYDAEEKIESSSDDVRLTMCITARGVIRF